MRTLGLLLRAGMHTALLFLLPWLTGALTGLAFDIDEVSETQGQFATYFSIIVVPLLVVQVVAIIVKIGREMRAQKQLGERGFGVFVTAVDRHVRVLTTRGLGMAVVSMIMVALALIAKWGQFGVLAVAGLGLMYLASTIATATSAFSVRAFDDRVRRGRGAIDREMSPTVIDAGDPAEERFFLARVPVPPGFRLHIEEELPSRLGGDTRFALDRSVSRAEVTVSAPLPRTPRGVYRLGPAQIWYEDVFGLTRVFVAARACANLRALPRLRPVIFERRPRSRTKSEGALSILSRIATEEHFRTRPYVLGDDVRRVHWKQSVNTGQLIVRVPEAVPFSPTRVRLVLDTYLPPGWRMLPGATKKKPSSESKAITRAPDALDDVLDLLVESWVGLAHTLLRRGESVSLALALRTDEGTIVREIDCKRGEERKWRAIGADAAWQDDLPIDHVLSRIPVAATNAHKTSSVIVSAGLWLSPSSAPGTTFVIADGASLVSDPDAGTPAWKRLLFFDYPVGAEDNRFELARLVAPRAPAPELVRNELARATSFAIGHARAQNAPILLARRRGLALSLEAP